MTLEKILIADQQLEITSLKNKVKAFEEDFKKIHSMLICVGGPLNDNREQYNNEQLKIFFKIHLLTESRWED